MILNIRGPSLSGKSHDVRQLLKDYPSSEVWERTGWNKTRPKQVGHLLPGGLLVIGAYPEGKDNGGLDTLMPGRTELVTLWLERNCLRYPFVLFESTQASLSIGRYHELSERLAPVGGITFGFLNTPVSVVAERLVTDIETASTQWNRVSEIRNRLSALGETCMTLDWEDSYAQLITLLQTVGGWDPFSTPPITHPKVKTRYTLQDVWDEMQQSSFNGIAISDPERFKRFEAEAAKHREKFT